MFNSKYQILMLLEVLVLGLVQGGLKEYGYCNIEDRIHPKFECRKSCRGVIESPVGTCDGGLTCCHLSRPIVSLEASKFGYCVLDKVVDEQFECRKSCDEFVEIPKGKCATGLKCCFTISPDYGKDFTIAPETGIHLLSTAIDELDERGLR